jgi:probable addiction module antidote protein
MTMGTQKWRQYLIARLREHPEEIPGYLNTCLDADDGTFLTALKTVIEARYGGATSLSRKVGLHRVSIQNMLSERGNPRFTSLDKILNELGFRLSIVERNKSKRPRSKAG